MSFLESEARSFLKFEGAKEVIQAWYYCTDRECRYFTNSRVFNQVRDAHGPSCVVFKKEIEDEGMLWNAGNTSHCERGSLGDKNV